MKIYLKIGDIMTLIKKIINWFKSIFNRLFKKKNNNKILNRKEKKLNSKTKKQASIKNTFNEDMPGYMIISDKEKEKLVYSINLMKNLLIENHNKLKEKNVNELISDLKSNSKVNQQLFVEVNDNDKIFNSKHIELLIKELSPEEKKVIYDKQQAIIKNDNEFMIQLSKIDSIIDILNNNKLSIIKEEKIEDEINGITSDKNIELDIDKKIDNFSTNVCSIMENVDEDFLVNVVKKYNKINYITITTEIIDKAYERFEKLQEDFQNHRYNKYYYEREISKIKNELNKVRDLKSRKDVNEHINNLKKELYTKSKDKYDLLYNNEIFVNIEKECDFLLNKINAKVIDIKKEEKIEKKNDEKDDYIKQILKRFKDMELARRIILLMQEEDKNNEKYEITDFINNIYNRYEEGLDEEFNFERNKNKTELVILYNGINGVMSKIKKEPYIKVDHINFKMNDLIEASKVKKNELKQLLKTNNIQECDDTLVDKKINCLQEKICYKQESHVLKKCTNNGGKGTRN